MKWTVTPIAADLSIRPKVNGQLNLAGFIDFFYQ